MKIENTSDENLHKSNDVEKDVHGTRDEVWPPYCFFFHSCSIDSSTFIYRLNRIKQTWPSTESTVF